MGVNMGLFKHKETKQSEQKQIDRNEKRYNISYSTHFKGFKTFPVVVHGNEETEKNNKLLLNNDFSNSVFEFVCYDENTQKYNGRVCNVFIDNLKVGSVFDEEQIKQIETGQIVKIHVEKKNNERLTYFVKYAD